VKFLRDTYGSATLITDPAKLPTNLEDVDAVILSPSMCQSTSQMEALCSSSSTTLRNLKTGVVSIGSGMVWKKLELTNSFSRFFESQAQLQTIDFESTLQFPTTLATYSSDSTGGRTYLQSSLLFLLFWRSQSTNTLAFFCICIDDNRLYGSIFERGDLLADGSKAIGRRATFGLFSNVYADTISEDFLKAFNHSVWYTARADRIDALKFDWTMIENQEHSVKISYQAITARTLVCDVTHEGSLLFI
jgi:hypothetical protein